VATADLIADCESFRRDGQAVRDQIAKVIVGQTDIIDGLLMALFSGGHVLLEGVPGLGKTALVKALASALDLKFNRIQFTPDLMPADITGTNVLSENNQGQRGFTFLPGPVFTQILLADEINRGTPKTQSALLEAMQERQVTAGGELRHLPPVFAVFATQNPLEQEGTYPLPESQLDRFFFKLIVGYGTREEMMRILDRTTAGPAQAPEPVLDEAKIIHYRELIRHCVIAPHIQDYAVRCVMATHPNGPFATAKVNQFLRAGASPRAAQAMVLGGKVRAIWDGRFHVAIEDLRTAMLPAVRHRVMLNFQADAQGVSPDEVLADVLEKTPVEMK